MATNRIHAKGDFRHIEHIVETATITPGMLCELNANDKVIRQATEGEKAEAMVAMEDALQGNTITDAYAIAARAMLGVFAKGSEANVLVKAGENIAIGDGLIAAGDGTLIEDGSESTTSIEANIIAYALETLDLTASAAVDTLCRVRFR